MATTETAPISSSGDSGSPQLVKGLGLTSATSLVIGSMIGSGIFIVSADIARQVNSPALLIAAWIVTGFMTVVGALAYGELAAMMPAAGGQYVYLRESLGRLPAFLFGWTLFTVIQTGTIAALGSAFGKFLGVFFPVISSEHWIAKLGHIPPWQVGPVLLGNMDVGLNTQNLVGIIVIVLLTLVNIYGVKHGALVQNVFTFAKTAAFVVVLVGGFLLARNGQAIAENFGHFFSNSGWRSLHPVEVGEGGPVVLVGILTILAIAQVGSLFSADAWNNVTYTAGEIRNPRRNVPLSLAIGCSVVILLYIVCNFVYLAALPLQGDPHGTTVVARGIQFATEDRVGTAVMEQASQRGAQFMALAILLSTFGCTNGMILAGARVYYAMARDGLFFRAAGNLHPVYKTPVTSLVIQGVWSCILALTGTYSQLLDLTMFTVLVFYILTIGGLFVLRRTRPEAERPYRAFGYPVLPALYILMASFIDVVLLRYKPQYTWPGLAFVLLGIPVYFFWARSAKAQTVDTV